MLQYGETEVFRVKGGEGSMSARTLNLFSLFVSLFVLGILFRGLIFVLFFPFLACSFVLCFFGLLYVLDLCSCTRLPFTAQI